MNGLHYILMGAGFLLASWAMLKGHAGGRKIRKREPLSEALDEIRRLETSAVGMLNAYQVRLENAHRETTSRLETRIALLQQLLKDRDVHASTSADNFSPLRESSAAPVAHQNLLVTLLADAGFTESEIVTMTDINPVAIHQVLDAAAKSRAA